MICSILKLILVVGFVFYLTSCSNKSDAKQTSQKQTQDTAKGQKFEPNNNPYLELRNMALNATPEQLVIELPKDKTKIYGVVIDWGLEEGTATLVAFMRGDASLYLSSGGGIMGGVGRENVQKAVKNFIDKSETYLRKTTKTETTPQAEKNDVKFYFLTNNGKYVGQESMTNIENNTSGWLPLFEEGNNLITEIRKSTKDKNWE
ncbi:hypothetical protein [Pedobacter alpinus]